MLPIKTILHPTDFSHRSDNAFGLACSLAGDYGARLVVVHVASRPVISTRQGVIPLEPEWYEETMTAQLQERRPRNAAIPVEHRLLFGDDPAAAILQLARDIKADLIVMGTHGRTGLGRVLMGSVAEEVVRQAPCSVLTVKLPLAAAPVEEESAPEAIATEKP
jgi:nucleotide-binding universal stress UspA family protein